MDVMMIVRVLIAQLSSFFIVLAEWRANSRKVFKLYYIQTDRNEAKSMSADMRSTSKFISLILRHRPETIGVVLDEHGWADVRTLIDGVNVTGRHRLTQEVLEEIVRTDEKQRYAFNEDHTRIRANQGHSIPVDVELEQRIPPPVLYHGTGEKYAEAIDRQGLIPKGRLYVHLSTDVETARRVGSRHGRPVIYQVDCQRMAVDGHVFFLSANHVWLTKRVPAQYLSKCAGQPDQVNMTDTKTVR